MRQFETLLKLLGADWEVIQQKVEISRKIAWSDEAQYAEAVKCFLAGQDFMRLGRCIEGKQWHLVSSNSVRIKNHCSELGITCFDNYLIGIRAAVRSQNVSEALQIMSRITAKRVQIRNLLAEEKKECDM